MSKMEEERSQSQSLLAELEDNQITANSEISQSLLANDSEVMSESPFESSGERMIVQESQSQSLLAELEINERTTVLDSEEGKNLNADDSELMEVGQEANNIENSEELQHRQIEEIVEEEEKLEEDEGDEEDDHEDDENNSSKMNLPVGRIKKLMKICMQTNEIVEPDPEEQNNDKSKKGKQKGKGKGAKTNKNSDGSTAGNLVLTKEAIYLTTVATELFVAAVTQESSRVTASTKKKTMTVEHLKRALSGTECYEFLQGCFHPSLIIGE